MKPRLHHKPPQMICSSPRSRGGFFIPGIFQEKMRAELTKVNKLMVTGLLSMYCKVAISLADKPYCVRVNKNSYCRIYDSRLTKNDNPIRKLSISCC